MPSLTIKNMTGELLERLRQSAAQHRRSLNSEVLSRLERSLSGAPVDAGEFLRRVRALQERTSLPPLTDEILKRARSDGRP